MAEDTVLGVERHAAGDRQGAVADRRAHVARRKGLDDKRAQTHPARQYDSSNRRRGNASAVAPRPRAATVAAAKRTSCTPWFNTIPAGLIVIGNGQRGWSCKP